MYKLKSNVPKINGWVIARFNPVVCLDNVLDSFGDEVVERVDVLLHKASNLGIQSIENEDESKINTNWTDC